MPIAKKRPAKKAVAKSKSTVKKSSGAPTLRGGAVKSISGLKKSLKRRTNERLTRIRDEGLLVRFLTEPTEWFEFYEHYDDTREGNYNVPCVEGCEYCENGDKPSKRYLTNAVDVDENTSMLLVLPASAAEQVVKKYDRFKTILDRDYFLSREGTGFDTKYDVTPEAPSKMNTRKFEVKDLAAAIISQLDSSDTEEDDDDDETETSRPMRKVARPKKRAVLDDDADDEDEEDDDEEDEDDAPPARPVRRPTKKVAKRRR